MTAFIDFGIINADVITFQLLKLCTIYIFETIHITIQVACSIGYRTIIYRISSRIICEESPLIIRDRSRISSGTGCSSIFRQA